MVKVRKSGSTDPQENSDIVRDVQGAVNCDRSTSAETWRRSLGPVQGVQVESIVRELWGGQSGSKTLSTNVQVRY